MAAYDSYFKGTIKDVPLAAERIEELVAAL